MNSEHNRRLMSGEEVCEALGINAPELQVLTDTGQITPLVLCGRTKFDSADLERLIESYKAVARRRNDIRLNED